MIYSILNHGSKQLFLKSLIFKVRLTLLSWDSYKVRNVTYLTAPSKAAIAALNPAVVTSEEPSFFPLPSIPSKQESKAGVR